MPNGEKSMAIGWFLIAACTHGCAVQAWERGNLAKPHMAIDAHEIQSSFRGHSYGSREAAAPGNAGQGGGCGCY